MFIQKKSDRAVKYLRISREDGDKAESDSIGGQRDLIEDYAKQHQDITLVDEYVDDGYSGSNFDRPAFKRMIKDARDKKIDCIIVKDLSRLGRNYIETGKYLEKIFPDLGIRFIAVNDNYDNFDSSDDAGQIVVPIKNLINDAYCRDISVKIRSQLDTKRRSGRFVGSFATYGYKKDEKDKNHLVIDEYAAQIVQEIFKMKMDGISPQGIADYLNDMGVLPPTEYKRTNGMNYNNGFRAGENPKWYAKSVIRILQNEMYTGMMVQGKKRKINYKVKQCKDIPQENWIRVAGTHDAIISWDVFQCVQDIMKRDTRRAPAMESVSLFSGLLCCGDCGQNMVRRAVTKENGKKYFYYHCSTHKNGEGCSSHLISEKKLTELVLATIQRQIDLVVMADKIIAGIDNLPEQQPSIKVLDDQLIALQKEEDRYQDLKARLYEDLQEKVVTRDEFESINSRFSKKLGKARSDAKELRLKKEQLLSGKGRSDSWLNEIKSYQNVKSLNREMLVLLIKRIVVYSKNSVKIEFRYGDEMQEMIDYASSRTEDAKGAEKQ